MTVLSVLRAELLNQVLQGRKLSPVNQVELLGEEKMKKYTYKHTQLLSCSIRLVVIRRRSSKQPSALSKENLTSSCSRQPMMQTDYTKTQLEDNCQRCSLQFDEQVYWFLLWTHLRLRHTPTCHIV